MKVIDDGVIKYDRSNFTQCGPLDLVEYFSLEFWRKKLFELNLIGEYSEVGVGFGNLSLVYDYSQIYSTNHPQFIITGTQTGKYSELDGNSYTRVLDYDIQNLKIKTMGPIEASSEALTHAAIYHFNPNIKVVFHIHSPQIWSGMIKDQSDHTAIEIPYGTLEMARATERCIGSNDSGVFCMHGHVDGVVAYGKNLKETGELVLQIYKKYLKQL
jgi:ribulose-5-phosphate 4-epimerase/fuculose-1-phosphate aldolase